MFICHAGRRDLRRNKSVFDIQAHLAKVNSLSVTLDDRYLLSSGRDSALSLWVLLNNYSIPFYLY
jgi:hypothetical protein